MQDHTDFLQMQPFFQKDLFRSHDPLQYNFKTPGPPVFDVH